MKVPNTSGVVWHAPVIATRDYQGTVELKFLQLAANYIAA